MNITKASLCLALFFATTACAIACDVCGGSLSGNQWGVLPQFKRSSFGLRYAGQQFKTQHSLLYKENFSTERMQSLELSYRAYLAPRWQLMARLPLQYNQQTNNFAGTHTQLFGLGDATLSANFVLLNNTTDTTQHRFKQLLSINGGLKLPTGAFQRQDSSGTLINPYLQIGSGSLDFTLGASYTLRYIAVGWHNEANLRLTTPNKNNFQFGRRLSYNSSFFYWLQTSTAMFMFQGGALYEQNAADKDQNTYLNGSAHQSLSARLSADIYYRNYSAGIAVALPLWQRADNNMLNRQLGIQAQINYLF